MLSNISLEEIDQSFQWSGLDLRNIIQERKSTFVLFQKAVYRVLLNKLWRTSEWQTHIKIEMLSKPLISHNIGIQTISYCMLCVSGSELVNFSMSQEVKKEPFAALIIASSQKIFLTYSQKSMWFYLLSTEDSLMGKVYSKRRQRQVVWRDFVPLQIYIYITPIRRNPRGAEFQGNLTCFC